MGAELHLRPATTYAHRGCLTSFNPDPHTTTTTTSMASDRAGPSPVPQPAAPEPPETSYRQNHVRRSLVRPGGCVKRIPPTWPRPSPPHLTPESQATHDARKRAHPDRRLPPRGPVRCPPTGPVRAAAAQATSRALGRPARVGRAGGRSLRRVDGQATGSSGDDTCRAPTQR